MYMLEHELKKTIELLVDLDNKTKELDKCLQKIRIDINKDLWDLIKLRKSEKNKNSRIQKIYK